jgi:hypothetical protein
VTLKLLAAIVFIAALVFAVDVLYASAQDDFVCESTQCRKDLAAARAGTAAYHDFQTAVADQFIPVFGCIDLPSGAAMGFHYINIQRRDDATLDPANPEVLIYMPNADGEFQLVAVEYLRPGTPEEVPPVLFGHSMEYNTDVAAWTFHAWIWKSNPDGIFRDFNQKLRCPVQ